MQLIGEERDGTKWYFADNGFKNPGVYYWDGKKNIHAGDRIKTLAAEVRRLQKDGERLDWLSEQCHNITSEVWIDNIGLTRDKTTVRQAIDAAITTSTSEGNKV